MKWKLDQQNAVKFHQFPQLAAALLLFSCNDNVMTYTGHWTLGSRALLLGVLFWYLDEPRLGRGWGHGHKRGTA